MLQSARVIFIGGSILLAMVFVSAVARNASLKASPPSYAADTSASQCIDPQVLSQTVAERLKKLESRSDVSRDEVRRAYAVYHDVLKGAGGGARTMAEKQSQSIDAFEPAQNTGYRTNSDAPVYATWPEKIRATFPPWWDPQSPDAR
jgi:hypothetical protein